MKTLKDHLDSVDPSSEIPFLTLREKAVLVRELRRQHGIVCLNIKFRQGVMAAHEKLDLIIATILKIQEDFMSQRELQEMPVAWSGARFA